MTGEMWLIVAIAAVGMAVIPWACLAISGRISREEEQREWRRYRDNTKI